MNRRDFLKGLMTLAGTVALGEIAMQESPLLGWETPIAYPTRPYGNLGSVRLNEEWFALEDASITVKRIHQATYVNHSPYGVGQESSLVNSPWQIDFYLRDSPYHLMETSEFDFEIDTQYMNFSGRDFGAEIGSELRLEGQRQLYTFSLEGDSRLDRKRIA